MLTLDTGRKVTSLGAGGDHSQGPRNASWGLKGEATFLHPFLIDKSPDFKTATCNGKPVHWLYCGVSEKGPGSKKSVTASSCSRSWP